MAPPKPRIGMAPEVVSAEAAKFGKTFNFRLRQHAKGNFRGLWELASLSPSGTVEKMIADADALPYCLENLQGELETDGY